MKKKICFLIAQFIFIFHSYAQEYVDFATIPKAGTIMVFAHQDDDFIWMLPFWSKCEKFICGGMPPTPVYETAIQNQQAFLNSNGYNIEYESNWVHPWDNIAHEAYMRYYLNDDPSYNYIANDHLTAFWDNNNALLTRKEVNKIKSKIEPHIASAGTSRIIAHNIWGEYGAQHHRAISQAVRELAVKYRKDVWMLGCNNGNFVDITVPPGLTYTLGNFDNVLYSGLKSNYQTYGVWTGGAANPSGDHKFIKIVDAGVDKTSILTGETVSVSGPAQEKPGAYIFEGVDDYVALPGNQYPFFTISMWIRPDQVNAMDISKMTEYPSFASCDRSFYLQNDGRVSARINDGQTKTVTSQSVVSAGTWTHILMTGNGSVLRLYFNGVLEGEISTGALYSGYNSPEFVLGQAQETASFFRGQISDVRLYDYVLAEDEITAVGSANPPLIRTITAAPGINGTISPPGSVITNQGADRTFAITADQFYLISDVKVDNVSVGAVSSYTFTNITADHTITASFKAAPSVAFSKHVFCQSNQVNHGPQFGNDGDATNGSYWAAGPFPQWWKVDLGSDYDIALIVIRNWVDNSRYYRYEIHGSTDDLSYTKIGEKTNNHPAGELGDSYYIKGTYRYLKVILTYNSNNSGVHISDFRVYGTLHISTWTGASSSDWHTTTNWFGDVPDPERDIKIPLVANAPVIMGAAVCNNLTIDALAKLEIAGSGSLTVNGSLTNLAGAGGIVVESDAYGAGSLIEKSGAAATVQRFIANDWNWHLLSSPVANQDMWAGFAQVPAFTGSTYQFPASPWYWDLFYYNPNIPATGLNWINLRKNTAGDYNDGPLDADNISAGFKDASGTFPPEFEKGRGYLVAYANGWMAGSPETHAFAGPLNAGEVNRALINNSKGSDYNLVGNPYPSSIDWDLPDSALWWGRSGALASSGQGYDYWVWDAKVGQYRYRNSYSHLGNASQYIEPGQGFFVKAAGSPGSLTFRDGIRTHNTGLGWAKSTLSALTTIRLKLTTDANSFFDELFVDFNPAYTGLEGTQKLWSYFEDSPEICSVKEGRNYSIDRYQSLSEGLSVSVSAKCGITGIYTLTATNISGFTLCKKVYLEDLKTGNKINLKENNSYSFTGSPDDVQARFKLSFAQPLGWDKPETVNQVYIYSLGKDVYINENLADIGICDVLIYDALGRMVQKGRFEPGVGTHKYTTLDAVPGTYLIKVVSHTGITTGRIIIM